MSARATPPPAPCGTSCPATRTALAQLAPIERDGSPVERMLQIHHAIQAGKFPNASKLAAQFEVSRKSIQRDLAFMRDRLSLPIEYDSARWGYYYSQEVSAFPTLQISEGEVFALLVAEKALQQYRGTTFERPLRTAFAKMASSLPENISLNLSEWDQTISFRTSVEPVLNLKVFDTISRATARHQQLRIRYRKPGQSDAETRVVDPYHLGNINGEWFLFAFDHGRQAVRTFAPARISPSMTRLTFPSLPGMAWLDRMMVSSSPTFNHLLSPRDSSESADIGSPCDPVEMTHTLCGGNLSISSTSMNADAGTSISFRSMARRMFFCMLRPINAIFRSCSRAASITCCTRWMWLAKLAVMMRRPFCAAKRLRNTAPTLVSLGA